MSESFGHKFHYSCLAMTLISFAAVIGFDSYLDEDAGKPELELITGRFVEWGVILEASESLIPSDFEKIDFSLPRDANYGDDPMNEFFNPAGRFKARMVPQKWIDALTTKKMYSSFLIYVV